MVRFVGGVQLLDKIIRYHPFLYSQKLYKNKLLYYHTIMNNEELIKENKILKEELEKIKNELVNVLCNS